MLVPPFYKQHSLPRGAKSTLLRHSLPDRVSDSFWSLQTSSATTYNRDSDGRKRRSKIAPCSFPDSHALNKRIISRKVKPPSASVESSERARRPANLPPLHVPVTSCITTNSIFSRKDRRLIEKGMRDKIPLIPQTTRSLQTSGLRVG